MWVEFLGSILLFERFFPWIMCFSPDIKNPNLLPILEKPRSFTDTVCDWRIIYNYPPQGRWIVVDTYLDASRLGIYPPLSTSPEGDSCFSIYQIRWIKNASSISSSEAFTKRCAIFLSVRKTVQGYSELREPIKTRENCYPLIW